MAAPPIKYKAATFRIFKTAVNPGYSETHEKLFLNVVDDAGIDTNDVVPNEQAELIIQGILDRIGASKELMKANRLRILLGGEVTTYGNGRTREAMVQSDYIARDVAKYYSQLNNNILDLKFSIAKDIDKWLKSGHEIKEAISEAGKKAKDEYDSFYKSLHVLIPVQDHAKLVEERIIKNLKATSN